MVSVCDCSRSSHYSSLAPLSLFDSITYAIQFLIARRFLQVLELTDEKPTATSVRGLTNHSSRLEICVVGICAVPVFSCPSTSVQNSPPPRHPYHVLLAGLSRIYFIPQIHPPELLSRRYRCETKLLAHAMKFVWEDLPTS